MGRRLDEQDGVDGNGEISFVDEEFGGGGIQPSLAMDNGDAEVAFLLSSAWIETYTRQFLPTAGSPVKDDKESRAWSENLEMPDLAEANKRDIRKELETAVKSHVDVQPDLSRMPSYQYNNEIFESEGMDTLPKVEEPKMSNLDEKLLEVAEDLKRIGVSKEDDTDTYLAKLKKAYDKGDLESWMGQVDLDSPEVPTSDLEYDGKLSCVVL